LQNLYRKFEFYIPRHAVNLFIINNLYVENLPDSRANSAQIFHQRVSLRVANLTLSHPFLWSTREQWNFWSIPFPRQGSTALDGPESVTKTSLKTPLQRNISIVSYLISLACKTSIESSNSTSPAR
jgi:hypothetical protein